MDKAIETKIAAFFKRNGNGIIKSRKSFSRLESVVILIHKKLKKSQI